MKVLLIEDEYKVVQTLRQGLNEHGIDVEYAQDGEEGFQIAHTKSFDVIISDVIMPKMNGIDVIKKLRIHGNKTPVLLLTALSDTDHKVLGLEAGADDYLVKPFEFIELLARIRAISRRGQTHNTLSANVVLHGLELNLDTKIVKRDGKTIALTSKEYQLLEYLMKNKGRPITKIELAEHVWNIDFDTNTNIIEVYINYLRNKVDKPYDKKLIHTIFGIGYILKEE
ncbi:MAG TPA: response regulator transcription factor [Saprospiraceae bacterium]|nr:response regulator transcription factor [Saprospiraceae bacterium]